MLLFPIEGSKETLDASSLAVFRLDSEFKSICSVKFFILGNFVSVGCIYDIKIKRSYVLEFYICKS